MIKRRSLDNFFFSSLPDWAENRFSDMERIAQKTYSIKTHNKLLKRLRSGFLLRDMLSHFSDKKNSKLDFSIWLYSGHDGTVFSLLKTLGLLDGENVILSLLVSNYLAYLIIIFLCFNLDAHPTL